MRQKSVELELARAEAAALKEETKLIKQLYGLPKPMPKTHVVHEHRTFDELSDKEKLAVLYAEQERRKAFKKALIAERDRRKAARRPKKDLFS
jgi:hypothetical protein